MFIDSSWESIEQVRDSDFMQGWWRAWKAEKHRGVDCDARPLPFSVSETGMRPSFAQAWNSVAHELQWNSSFAQPIRSPVFGGTSAFSDLCGSVAASGLEPLQYLDNVMSESGLNWMSELAVELTQLFHALFSLAVTDLVDLKHSSTAELLSRRTMEILRAFKRWWDFGSLEAYQLYARHAAVRHGSDFAPKFRASLARMMRDEVLYLKQTRLAREEEEAKTKKPTMGKGSGTGGDGGGGDSKGYSGGGGKDRQGASAPSNE